jgi:DNA recombination protein RmuC
MSIFFTQNSWVILISLGSFLAGFISSWIWWRNQRKTMLTRIELDVERQYQLQHLLGKLEEKEQHSQQLRSDYQTLLHEKQHLENEVSETRTRMQYLEQDAKSKEQQFTNIAQQVLQQAHQSFINMAQQNLQNSHLIQQHELDKQYQLFLQQTQPINQDLVQYQQKLTEIQQNWTMSYTDIKAQLQQVEKANQLARQEVSRLNNVLRQSAQQRGRWGEIALRNILEMAGMTAHCDFVEQAQSPTSTDSETERGKRPDVIVNLPGKRQIVIDAKVILESYMLARETSDEQQQQSYYQQHAGHVRSNLMRLAKKDYAQGIAVFDLVILFIPGDHFYQAALEADPSLFEDAFEKKILIATPTTLIALLRVIEWGWRQHNQQESWEETIELINKLNQYWRKTAKSWSDMGNKLGTAIEHYNSVIGDFEKNILPTLHKVVQFQSQQDKISPPIVKSATPKLINPQSWDIKEQNLRYDQN